MLDVRKILVFGLGDDATVCIRCGELHRSVYYDVLRAEGKKDNIERKIGKRGPVLGYLFGKEFSDIGHFRRSAMNISKLLHIISMLIPALIGIESKYCNNRYAAAVLYGLAVFLAIVVTLPLKLLFAWPVDILLIAMELPLHPLGYVIDSVWGGVQRLQAGNHEATVEASQDALNPS